MQFNIALLPGDGVGPEIITEGVKVLRRVQELTDATFNVESDIVGGIAIDEVGAPLPKSALDLARRSDAVLFGGGWEGQSGTTHWLHTARRTRSWVCERLLACSPTCARSRSSRPCSTPAP